jgi:hypothetical protein
MPERFVRPEISGAKPSHRVIESIAQRYQTSLFASTRRFLELTDQACAAVFFRGGYVQYVWRSKLFEKQRYRIHKMLDPYTFAFEAAMGNEVPDYMSTVSASAWFCLPPDCPPSVAEGGTLLEEARYYSSLNLGMSLLWLHRPLLLRKR